MTIDNELRAWREEWAAQPQDQPDLMARVKRQSLLMRLTLLVEVLVTMTVGGGVVWLAVTSGQADVALLAGATWLFLAAAWGFAVWNRRGAWSPVALTSSAYLDISIRRCRGSIRATAFGIALYLVEMIFCLAWIYHRTGGSSFLYSTAMTAVGVATILFLVAIVVYRVRKKRELTGLLRMEKSTR